MKRTRLALSLLGFVMLIAACSGPMGPYPVMAREMLTLVNQQRAAGAQCGDTWRPPAPPLQLDWTLIQVAQDHSKDMLQMRKLTHTGSDGSNPGQRITRAGYAHAGWGENAAAGYPTVESVVQGWTRSPGHCRNLMNPSHTEMGIGRAGNYWTQVFARPKPQPAK